MVRLTESRSSESDIALMINVAQPSKEVPLLFYAPPLRGEAFALFEIPGIGMHYWNTLKKKTTGWFFQKYEPHFCMCLKRPTKKVKDITFSVQD